LERIATAEERIRRAEEIYQRRRQRRDIKVPTSNFSSNNKIEYGMFKKLALQIIICILIYFIFYLIKNSNYIFSEAVLNKTREFLSYDINFAQVYSGFQEYYDNNLKHILYVDEEENKENTNIVNNEVNDENTNTNVNEEVSNEQTEGGIGGGEEGIELLNNITEEVSADETADIKNEEPLSQMEIDANYIKENYNLILPLKGTVTSRFGPRTPTQIVSANHAGIDIGVNEGTVFIASMEGTVLEVSSEGGYGNHVYIQKGDVITLYAHCKTIYVKNGDTIVQGQQVGEVGSTGNATGPHLHFEIRRSDRVVNPEYILTF